MNDLSQRASRLVGRVLRDKWRLDALIGVGGMASVFAATHRNGKRVAVKLLHPELSLDERTRGRFLREGYVANKVGHPGVVSVLDDDTTEDGAAFLVMDLLEGETLKERWRRSHRRMPVGDVLRITHALLDVLAAAHEKGIVHRDLKPDNVFLTNDGAVKVLDFGIARLREASGDADATRSSAMLGTPAFMAPEQARSRWDWVDARTDLWALGATMFTMLSGKLVHEADTVTEVLIAAATQRAQPLRAVAPDMPESVAAIVDRALQFEQAERWQDARSMQAAVSALLAAGVELAPAASAARAPVGPVRTTQPLPTIPLAPSPTLPLESPRAPSSSDLRAPPPSYDGRASAGGPPPQASTPGGSYAIQSSWPRSSSEADAGGGSTLMGMGAQTAIGHAPPLPRAKPPGLALIFAGAAALLLGGVLAGVFLLSPRVSTDAAAGAPSAEPSADLRVEPTAAAAPPTVSVVPAPETAAVPEPPQPTASASAPRAASARAGEKKPPRTTAPPKGTTKSTNPLDKY